MSKKVIQLTEEKLKTYIREVLNEIMEEGIDFDPETKTVSYNASHEENIDTSYENNPTSSGDIVPDVAVWSIFKRKRGLRGDGNPLIYALKNEGWRFRTRKDRNAIERQINLICEKFVNLYPVGITILMPSGSYLNTHIANIIMSKSKDVKLIEGIILKMTTDEVEEIVLDFNSKFRQYYKENFNAAYKQLCNYLDDMDENRGGDFSRHFVKDGVMRDVIDTTLKLSTDRYAEYANKINGQDILIIDDTISRGQTIQEACRIIKETYSPKSITVLTLLSKLD